MAPVLLFDPSGIVLDPSKGLSHELYQAIRKRILDGRLVSGTRLPASRDLATMLRLSRNSVTRAYDQLFAEGYIASRIGDGTYVAQLSTVPSVERMAPTSTRQAAKTPEFVSRVANDGLPRAFRVGIPAFDLFPFAKWAQLQARFWRKPDLALLGYSDPRGDHRLRTLIAAYLRSARGLSCSAENILITSGSQQAVSLCGQLFLRPGDPVAVENPGYRAAVSAFIHAGAKPVGIAVDSQGLDCAALAEVANCRLVYVTPSHQYPTGVTMSVARRLELLAWAQRNDGWIIEDDYDSEYRYHGAPLAPLAALDRQGRVLYVGTFSKIAFPGLRLGYLVLPDALMQRFAERRAADVRHSEIGTQVVMADFIEGGDFQRHIRRMRRAALKRLNVLQANWPLDLAGCAPFPVVDSGLHVSLPVVNLAREEALVTAAASVGVEVNRLSRYWLADSTTPADKRAGLVLGFAGVNEIDVAEALRKLRRVWQG